MKENGSENYGKQNIKEYHFFFIIVLLVIYYRRLLSMTNIYRRNLVGHLFESHLLTMLIQWQKVIEIHLTG